MLEGTGDLQHPVGVHAGLVGEGVVPHVGHGVGQVQVGDGGHLPGAVRQQLQPLLGDAGDAQLQLQVGDHRRQVGVAAALPKAQERPLDLGRPGHDPHDAVGHGHAAVVVKVHPHRQAEAADHLFHHRPHLLGEGPAVGVAQAQLVGAPLRRGLQGRQGEVPVVLVAVEEVLPVEDHHLAPVPQKPAALPDHAQVFLGGGLQHVVHVEFPALAEQDAHLGPRPGQGQEVGVLLGLYVLAAGAAESRQLGVLQAQLPRPAEELLVLGVRAGVPRLDVGHPQLVQQPDGGQFVLYRKGDARALGPIPQGGVQNGHACACSSSSSLSSSSIHGGSSSITRGSFCSRRSSRAWQSS